MTRPSALLALTLTLGAGIPAAPVLPPPSQSSTAAPPVIDVEKVGPQVGDEVPEFTLSDQAGRSRTLQSLMGPKGVMLVFFRSADW